MTDRGGKRAAVRSVPNVREEIVNAREKPAADIEDEPDIGVKQATRVQVLETCKVVLVVSTVLVPISIAQIGVWAAERGSHPLCEEEQLEDWFAVSGFYNLLQLVLSWVLWFLTRMSAKQMAEMDRERYRYRGAGDTGSESQGGQEQQSRKDREKAGKRFWSADVLVWVQVMSLLFQFGWWCAGISWVFSATEKNCGKLVTDGRPIFITQLALLCLFAVIMIGLTVLASRGFFRRDSREDALGRAEDEPNDPTESQSQGGDRAESETGRPMSPSSMGDLTLVR
eukprot:TRINITY_DN47073_c0_g1_i1.p1 TRINITY_DN47073_c0_g1~~TRINITY_DN47073_c0_g1_i1.p1  ORF type:complete len:312 (+),score=122.19 TRINITY_DN47073_c0_g1_i1:90-938(+)